MYLNLDVFEIVFTTQKTAQQVKPLEKHTKVRETTLTMGSKKGWQGRKEKLDSCDMPGTVA